MANSKPACPVFKLPSRSCGCGGKIEGMDPHPVCIACLGLQHAASAITHHDCEVCAFWSDAVLLRRLAAANSTSHAGDRDQAHTSSAPSAGHAGRTSSDSREGRPRHRATPPARQAAPQRCETLAKRPGSPVTPRGLSMAPDGDYDDQRSSGGDDLEELAEEPSFHSLCEGSLMSPRAARRSTDEGVQTYDDDDDDDGGDYEEDDSVFDSASTFVVKSTMGSTLRAGDDTASQCAASKPDSAIKTLRTAVERCGLVFADQAPAVSAPETQERMPGARDEPPKKSKTKKLPVVQGLRAALHSAWMNQGDPAALGFPTEMEDWAALGLARAPPIGRRLAECFASTVKNQKCPYVLSDDPKFADRKTQSMQQASSCLYERTTRVVKDCNAMGLLFGSMSKLLKDWDAPEAAPQVQELITIVELCVSLNDHALRWVGHVLATIVRQDRDRWTEPMHLASAASEVRSRLRGLPIAPNELFPEGFDIFRRYVDDKKASQEMAAAVAPLDDRPPPPANAPKNKQAKRSTSASSVEHPAPATPSFPAGSNAQRGGKGRSPRRDGGNSRYHGPQRYFGRGRGGPKRK